MKVAMVSSEDSRMGYSPDDECGDGMLLIASKWSLISCRGDGFGLVKKPFLKTS